MRRSTRLAISGALLAISVAGASLAAAQGSGPVSSTPMLTFDGDTALWAVAIKPDKTGDFESVMRRMRDALATSEDAARRQQAAGWRVLKMAKPLADGNIAYVHIIHPVVRGVDYSIMQTLYDAFPQERKTLYEQYRGAFAQSLSIATGSIVIDLAQPQ